jgi:hypothetical protein
MPVIKIFISDKKISYGYKEREVLFDVIKKQEYL